MLVRCPQCKTEIRLTEVDPNERVVKYLCPGCQSAVRIDLELDEVKSSSSTTRAVRSKKTVLVADDAPSVLETAEKLLSAAGYQVLLAADGAEALQRVKDEHPDLVLLDLLMPRLTGFEVLREIRHDERVKNTPVLAMSGVYKENVLNFLQELGAQGFLDKEQLADVLVFRVNSLLEATPSA